MTQHCLQIASWSIHEVHGKLFAKENYRIRPNYRTVRLGFSNLLGTLIRGKICTHEGYTIKRSEKDLFDDDYAIIFWFSL